MSLWNPLDYLVLLYWVFYFPQTLRWYVETFSRLSVEANGWLAVRQDSIQCHLALQGIVLTITSPLVLAAFLHWLGLPVDWIGVVISVVVSVAAGVVVGVMVSVAAGVVVSVALGAAGGVALGMAPGMAIGVATALSLGVVVSVVGGVASLRVDVVLLALLPALAQPSQRLAFILHRPSGVPIPRLRQRLVQHMTYDWFQGLCKTEGLLRYSLQFIPVIAAVQQALERMPPTLLLERIAT